jgi:GTPase SAR1 family protein
LKENSGSNVVLGVAGNKCDLYESEDVKESEARQFAEEIGAIFELTSAQNNTGINELFFEVGNKYLDPNFKPSKDEDNPDNKDDKKKIVLKKDDVKKDDKKPRRSFC